ncbi:uncharacterized protein DS421_19g665530 [Arachis hypogaea]|uniref:Uncharacterized protein n=1 Tax=Arachis hypogaea TaxID=3818 RepID=A0A6B9VBG7_ARAHY|nr:uncharacterized protein DS421_19g665530 [Arachis hypogaea]
MTDRKGKGKAKASSIKRKRTQPAAEIVDELLSERQLGEKEKADQNTPSSDAIKFANLYCELRFLHFLKNRSLHVERKLQIPPELRNALHTRLSSGVGYFWTETLSG